jgi:hypothetical protein
MEFVQHAVYSCRTFSGHTVFSYQVRELGMLRFVLLLVVGCSFCLGALAEQPLRLMANTLA